MTKTITIDKKVTEISTRRIEVTLPVYSRHDLDGDSYSSTWFRRIDEDLVEFAIHKHHYGGRKNEWEMEVEHLGYLEGTDYQLGKGEYESSEDEFNEVLAEFIAVLGNQLTEK